MNIRQTNRVQNRLASLAAVLVTAVLAATAGQATEMKIGFYPGAVMTIPSWIAEAKGFYAAEGIEAILIPVANGPMMSSNTASGAIDIGYNSPSNVGLTREQGLYQLIVVGNMYMPIVLIARTDVKLPNQGKYPQVIADLKGLNWGSFGRGSDIENIMRVMAKDAGLDPANDIAWIGVGPPVTGLPALKAGRVDVYGTTMPGAEVAIAAGYGKIVVDLRRGEGPSDFRNSVYSVLLALRKRVEEQPELFTKFVNAHKRMYCWAKDPKNFEEAAQIVKSKLPVAELSDAQYLDLVKHALGIITVKYPPSGLEGWNKVMVAGGVLKGPMPAEVVWKGSPLEDPNCR